MSKLEHEFWKKKPMADFSRAEWESLCDRCGRCCVEKLENRATGEIFITCVACRLLDTETGLCGDYRNRYKRISDCIEVDPFDDKIRSLLPETCAYRLVYEGKDLPEWHYLVSGDTESVHKYNISVRGKVVSWHRGIRLEEYIVEKESEY